MNRLDPRTKLVMLFSISCVAMLTSNVWFLLGLLVFTIVVLFLGNVGLERQKKQLKGIITMLVFLFVIQALFGQAYFGAVLCIRLVIVVMSALILLTGEMRDYLLALTQMKVPYELAYMVVLAFHFFPILREEALDVYHSIQLRGCELKKTSLKNKLLAFKGMCIPILAGALSRAEDTAIAMEARGFRMYRRRTYLRKLTLKKKDIALMVLFPILAVGFVTGAHLYDNSKVPEPKMQVTVSLINNSKIAVSWTDEEQYDGVLRMGFGKYEAECTPLGDQYRYTAMVDELKAGKSYSYTVGHGRKMSEEITYVHAVDAKDYSFLYFGGVQGNAGEMDSADSTSYDSWCEMVNAATTLQEDTAFALFGGNLIRSESPAADWQMVFADCEPSFLNRPMMTAIGENEATDPAEYCQAVAMPKNGKAREEYYYFDYGDAFILTLNSCLFADVYQEAAQSQEDYQALVEEATDWLDRMLRTNDRPWVIVNMHHSMFPEEGDESAVAQQMAEYWLPLFEEYDVDLVLSGQDGCYTRTESDSGIAYVNVYSGTGDLGQAVQTTEKAAAAARYVYAGPAYLQVQVTEASLDVTAFDTNHQQIDSLQIH